jgi:NADPH-dependent 2,4-dienoyl-CoA reductase/sulfur reductase-like enzyme/nitrite reductase/ring-hydroxylating ferredoxin subunit
MGDAPKVGGPDLAAGIALATLEEGKPLVGHVGDESVMLVRAGDAIFATGATCTHYSGPLAEGLVRDGTVTCPWHHACFDLRTGNALAAPARDPIACFDVEHTGDLVRVGQKRGAAPKEPITKAAPASVVIVGGGAAGEACAEELRARGYRGQVVLLSADASLPVDRPNLSKDYLAGTAPEEWLPLRGPEWYAEHGIEVSLGTPVQTIDLQKRQVMLASGRSYGFDRLLFATGAEPVHLKIPGAEHAQVRYLRSLADSRAIIAEAQKGKRAVVIGASFIGLEVAASLRTREVEVHMVAPDEVPLGKIMGPELGGYLKRLHESRGVQFHLGRKPAAIEETARGMTVRLDDDSVLDADFVVIGVGVRPATALAQAAGLQVEDGVLVDEKLQASGPGVFAAGDVARYRDRSGQRLRIEHWVVAQRMGQTAARNMLGAEEKFDDVPFFWSAHYDVSVNYVGHGAGWDRSELTGSPDDKDCAVRYFKGDQLVAVATIYRDQESLQAAVTLGKRR